MLFVQTDSVESHARYGWFGGHDQIMRCAAARHIKQMAELGGGIDAWVSPPDGGSGQGAQVVRVGGSAEAASTGDVGRLGSIHCAELSEDIRDVAADSGPAHE
jgi:hypothetical protein